ncbi:acetylcholine receptor subunit beta-like 1 isoform X2 [Lingula anatina]|uniref:Acetylcholine receptor subunit beta-like 1 isoform X2 n=1 Tax=Lingula anatina TaxID=7574 RepID=A0A1S3JAA5_LINAN|nr:acetylcholine receptor subunit beta-like 1 isoform X2 [Lingula anatina]|eukprot:XP_013406814.1 acetylcholine receptor subunit beta-like 1 isoform X2 [Lingula anatina]
MSFPHRMEHLLVILTLLLSLLVYKGLGSEDESKLVEDLFDKTGYNPLIRPVQNLSDKLMINFGLTMIQLINVDEKNQIMKTNVWLQTVWYDYQLVWDPADYGGISSIRVPMDKVWTPDIVLFNNADGKYQASYRSNVVIYKDGLMLHVPPAIYKSACQIDVQYFPFDEQECEMRMGSWTFNGDQVGFLWHMNLSEVDFNDYMPSGTWDILRGPGQIVDFPPKDGKPMETRVIFTIKIRRKTLFYTVNLIIPCVLISFLSVGVFYLPSDGAEKITLCISILIALVVFILLVSKMLPPTSLTIPLIAKFLLFTFIMNILSIFSTVIIINWHFRSPRSHSMPKWVRIVFLNYLPRLLCMKRPNHEEQYLKGLRRAEQKQEIYTHIDHNRDSKPYGLYTPSPRNELLELSELHNLGRSPSRDRNKRTYGNSRSPEHNSLPADFYDAADNVRFVAQHMQDQDEYNDILEDWKYVALVIDRLLLMIFLGVNIAGTSGIFLQAPNIFTAVGEGSVKAHS